MPRLAQSIFEQRISIYRREAHLSPRPLLLLFQIYIHIIPRCTYPIHRCTYIYHIYIKEGETCLAPRPLLLIFHPQTAEAAATRCQRSAAVSYIQIYRYIDIPIYVYIYIYRSGAPASRLAHCSRSITYTHNDLCIHTCSQTYSTLYIRISLEPYLYRRGYTCGILLPLLLLFHPRIAEAAATRCHRSAAVSYIQIYRYIDIPICYIYIQKEGTRRAPGLLLLLFYKYVHIITYIYKPVHRRTSLFVYLYTIPIYRRGVPASRLAYCSCFFINMYT